MSKDTQYLKYLTDEDKQFIKEFVPKEGVQAVSKALNIPDYTIKYYCKQNNIVSFKKIINGSLATKVRQELYNKVPLVDITNKYNIDFNVLKSYAKKYNENINQYYTDNVKKEKPIMSKFRKLFKLNKVEQTENDINIDKYIIKNLTDEQVKYILENKNKLVISAMANNLKIYKAAVYDFCNDNKLLYLTNKPNKERLNLLDDLLKKGEKDLSKLSQQSFITIEKVETILKQKQEKEQSKFNQENCDEENMNSNQEQYNRLFEQYNELQKQYILLQDQYKLEKDNVKIYVDNQNKNIKSYVDEYEKIKKEYSELLTKYKDLQNKGLEQFNINIGYFNEFIDNLIKYSENHKLDKGMVLYILEKSNIKILSDALFKLYMEE